jgi:hypothetical protein
MECFISISCDSFGCFVEGFQDAKCILLQEMEDLQFIISFSTVSCPKSLDITIVILL